MANLYDATCSCTSFPPEHDDDMSHFLHQILQRGKQVESFIPLHPLPENPTQSALFSGSDRISSSAAESSSAVMFPAGALNMSSSSVGTIDNDLDEYDCESEEGFEAVGEDALAKPTPPRNPSKRSRAAEVHNLSEKRRRSRINEKMKALQNLIPNSNKTDKASMLDEAIEYLKQLQLQVQMLTTRNGLSLYPMCLPGVLQPNQHSQLRMGFHEGNESLNMKMTGALLSNQETLPNTMFRQPNLCSNSNQSSVPNLSNVISSGTSFGLESSIQTHHGPFQLHTSASEFCREDLLRNQQLNVVHSETNLLEFHMGAKATSSIPFDAHASELRDNALESCILGRNQPDSIDHTDLEREPILSQHLEG